MFFATGIYAIFLGCRTKFFLNFSKKKFSGDFSSQILFRTPRPHWPNLPPTLTVTVTLQLPLLLATNMFKRQLLPPTTNTCNNKLLPLSSTCSSNNPPSNTSNNKPHPLSSTSSNNPKFNTCNKRPLLSNTCNSQPSRLLCNRLQRLRLWLLQLSKLW